MKVGDENSQNHQMIYKQIIRTKKERFSIKMNTFFYDNVPRTLKNWKKEKKGGLKLI